MLKLIGARSIDELFEEIPAALRAGTLALPAPMSDETDMLGDLISRRPNSRLSCQIVLNDSLSGVKVSIAPEE